MEKIYEYSSFDVGGTFYKILSMIDGKITQAGKIPTPQDSQESFLKQLKQF
ncbi:MAG: hypothetical protein ACLRQF_00915 [Thomasclavelia ramosa]